ncbi:hypothetical protein [Acetivibrio cellulolyticus]|uniref:hypothetical protein n=1 Tax=Acetivibrio cellulolyticus TaxID=35830 RepID=UPI0001E2E6B1|nr:hypothetical protein [Acetivibrio cellulolyticus]
MLIHRINVKGEMGFEMVFGKTNILLGENKTGKSTFMKLILYGLGTYIDNFIVEISKQGLCDYVELDIELKTGFKYKVIRKLPYSDTVIMIPINDDDSLDNENMDAKSIEEYSDYLLSQEGYDSQTVSYGNNKKATLRFYFLLRAVFVDQETTAYKIFSELGGKDKDYLNSVSLIKKVIIESLLDKDNHLILKLRLELQNALAQKRDVNSNINYLTTLIEQEINENKDYSNDAEKVEDMLKAIIEEKKSITESEIQNLANLQNVRNEKVELKILNHNKELLEVNDKLRALKLEKVDIETVFESVKNELEQLKKMLLARQLLTQIPVEQCPICLSPIMKKPQAGEGCPYCNQTIKENDYDNISKFKKMLEESLVEADQAKEGIASETSDLENFKVSLESSLLEIREEHIKELKELRSPIEEIINSLKIRYDELSTQYSKIGVFHRNLVNKQKLVKKKGDLDSQISSLRTELEEEEKNSMKDMKNIVFWQNLFDRCLKFIYKDVNKTYIDPEDYTPYVDDLEIRQNSSASLKVAARLSYVLSLFQLLDVEDADINHIGFIFFDSPKDKDIELPKYKRFLQKLNESEKGQVFLTASITEKEMYQEIFGQKAILRELYENSKLLNKLK